jgi:hypothetical protein
VIVPAHKAKFNHQISVMFSICKVRYQQVKVETRLKSADQVTVFLLPIDQYTEFMLLSKV